MIFPAGLLFFLIFRVSSARFYFGVAANKEQENSNCDDVDTNIVISYNICALILSDVPNRE